jgi:DNA-binding NtrC family response regulator
MDSLMPATIRLTGRVAVWSVHEPSRSRLAMVVRQNGYDAVMYSTLDELRQGLSTDDFAACVLDEPSSHEVIRNLNSTVRIAGKPTQFIVVPALADRAVWAQPAGCDVLDPPCTPEKLGRLLFSAVGRSRLVAENLQLKRRLEGRMFDDLVGISPAMDDVRRLVQTASEHDRPVLVVGEAGVGTTVVARAIHVARFGTRSPFLKLCSSVLASNLLEQELFGDVHHPGRLAGGQGGTLLLEDIETLSVPLQEQLARVLATGTFRPQGSSEDVGVRVRIVVSSHADLNQLVNEGKFHRELLRLCRQHTIVVPPLRDRPEDVAPLAEQFLLECSVREGQPQKRISSEALQRLRNHAWPGNVRQLQNVISRCCSLASADDLSVSDLEPWLEQNSEGETGEPGMTLAQMERKLIEATFNRYGGNRELTAKALSIGIRTLSGKLREYGYPPRGGPGSNKIAKVA